MTVVEATKAYENWAREHIKLLDEDLKLKHERMAGSAFPFLRATFYHWVMLWEKRCPELAKTPTLLAVGDLHVENFGTWRDSEGRLVWGVNDFDEAFPMPYAIDLVRLAASAILAIGEEQLSIHPDEACAAILEGYREAIDAGRGRAFVLEEEHPALRAMALGAERKPDRFWDKLTQCRDANASRAVEKLLRKRLPDPMAQVRIVHRVAGLGSLGRERYVALAEWHDGKVAREAKALLPSAYAWAMDADSASGAKLYYDKIVARSIRAPDPFLKIKDGWVLRRLSPHCSRIPLNEYPKKRDERHILKSMGRETANVHLGSPRIVEEVKLDLKSRGDGWLKHAAHQMAEATVENWEKWRKSLK